MERRLAAILVADVVGYSRLMEADEVDTLVALKSHREDLIDPTIADRNGRWRSARPQRRRHICTTTTRTLQLDNALCKTDGWSMVMLCTGEQ